MKRKITIGIDVDDCICNTSEMDYACAFYKSKTENALKGTDNTFYYDEVSSTFNIANIDDFYVKQKRLCIKTQ